MSTDRIPPMCGPHDLRLVPKTSDPEGLVGAIGAGMEDTALLTTLVRETDVEVLMLPGQCTLLDQSVLDGLLPACQERGASVIAAAVFHSGVLAQNRPRSRSNVWLPHRAVGGPGSSQPHRRGVRRG
jgi:aryl-alcohol dehydrogenase-like predicted oxidoreductase